ncbi:MAG: hypothetical protein AAGU73_00060 [Actinomycetota bacterium]
MDTTSRIAANHAIWQRWTELHVPSDFYDVEGFIADPDARPFDSIVGGLVGASHSWQHTFEEIVGSLVRAGLVIEDLREYPLIAWQFTPGMVLREDGLYGLPEGQPELPLTFTLTARKPG